VWGAFEAGPIPRRALSISAWISARCGGRNGAAASGRPSSLAAPASVVSDPIQFTTRSTSTYVARNGNNRFGSRPSLDKGRPGCQLLTVGHGGLPAQHNKHHNHNNPPQ
jgi:hypothetical protein